MFKCNFSYFLNKLIDTENKINKHNHVIENLKSEWEESKDILNDNDMFDYMKLLQLPVVRYKDHHRYNRAKVNFFGHMLDLKYQLDQIIIMFDLFLNYRVVLEEEIDFTKKINFNISTLLEQVYIYPKRLNLLLKQEIINEIFYESLNTEEWFNQSVKSFDKKLFYQLLQLKKSYYDLPNGFNLGSIKTINTIAETLYKDYAFNANKKIETIIEYLYAPKLKKEFTFDNLVSEFNYPTDQYIEKELEKVNILH